MNAQYSCLVVEDSPMMRQLLVFALSRVKSLHVTEADDGVDGLRKLAAGKFDIILTDINMPIMDGLKLVKRVRSDPTHKDVPIIVITTEGSSEDRQRALAARRERVHHQAHPGPAGHREGEGAAQDRRVTRIKICGVTSATQARSCVDAGADSVGVNFVPSSVRRVDPETARAIVARGRVERRWSSASSPE